MVRRRDRRPLGRSSPPRPCPRQGTVKPDALNAGGQVAGNLLHTVEPMTGICRVVTADMASTTTRPVGTSSVGAGALGRRRAVVGARLVLDVGGGGRRRSPQSHPDHRPPPDVDYTLDGRQRSGCRDVVPHLQLVVVPSTLSFVAAGIRT